MSSTRSGGSKRRRSRRSSDVLVLVLVLICIYIYISQLLSNNQWLGLTRRYLILQSR